MVQQLHAWRLGAEVMNKTKTMNDIEAKARAAMEKHEISPSDEYAHHTELPFTQEDREIAELSYWLGGLFVDKEYKIDLDMPYRETFWYKSLSSHDQWMRVARALRIHNLKIVNRT